MYPLPVRRHARTAAAEPEESTSTTWAAVTPEGTRQVFTGFGAAAWVGVLFFGGAAVVRRGVGTVAGAFDAVLVGVRRGAALVVREAGGAVVVVAGEADEVVVCGVAVAAVSSPPQAASANAARPPTAASRAAYRRSVTAPRSAGSLGRPTALPTSFPGW